MKKRIAIVFGGTSSEYKVSLTSCYSIVENINKDKYDLDLIGVTKEGNFYLYKGDTDKILNDTWMDENVLEITFSTNKKDHGYLIRDENKIVYVDLVYIIMHGGDGEDGSIEGMLKVSGIPYIGSDHASSSLCMNKYLAHKLVSSFGIDTPKCLLFKEGDSLDKIKKVCHNLYPLFVKPLRNGSSLGISKVLREEDLKDSIEEAFKYDKKITIEEEIIGFEVGCAIIGNENYLIGEVDEVVISEGFFDYKKKYESKKVSSIVPARISEKERERVKKVALEIYQILGCKDYARVDLFYTKDKKIVFNEINTIPGFTTHSRFPKMMEYIGYSFSDVIDEIIKVSSDYEN